ncbi:PHP domain-containing protein [Oculatella sp. LEGE 06141]|nr:PHP domain-containing protein [Oculatella sp. LEGE 06141]
MLELHCHTTFSDGTLTPTELVNVAIAAGVQALAITDHDTVAGWDEAVAAAAPHGLEIVPGLELSTVHLGRSLHILGFYPEPGRLVEPLNERLNGRKRRAQQMVQKLAALGYPIELPEKPGGMAPGRPHIAAAMVRAGYVQTSQEAFTRFIGEEKPAHVHYEKFSIVEGIDLLRSCGAVPVWAHPYLFRGGEVEDVLSEMVAAGLMGVEVYHPGHTSTQSQTLEQLCERYGLLMTGGSDYHGPISDPKGRHADTLNRFHLPLHLLDPIKQAAHDLHRSFESSD